MSVLRNQKGTDNMSNNEYEGAFTNMAKALQLGEEVSPEELGQAPGDRPRQIDVNMALGLNGTVAGKKSPRVVDQREHFPVTTEIQAQSSMIRAMQMNSVPNWYTGSLDNLREEVWVGVLSKHPSLAQGLTVPVAVEQALALSDGEESAETSTSDIEDPADVRKNEVKTVKRPTITSASLEELAQACEIPDQRKAIAGELMELLTNQETALKAAKKLTQRLLKSGLKSEEFDGLYTYLQEDILRELLGKGTTAGLGSSDRRRELLDRMTKNSG